MIREEFYYLSADGKTKIHAVEWRPEGEPVAVLQIAHGVTEHILRYEEAAEYFTGKGFVVVGNDHLGHGTSIAEGAEPMYFGPSGSWKWVVKDMRSCSERVKAKYPNIPYIVMGSSLGSFAIRTWLIRYPGTVDAAILVGTGQTAPVILGFIRKVAVREGEKSGEEHTTPLINKLTFENYNKGFAPNKTEFDWLCVSETSLDEYMKDPLRGEAISAGLFRELIDGMSFTARKINQKKMDTEMPILLISGAEDPVGDRGKGVMRTWRSFGKVGMKDVDMKIYPGLRHDILHDEGREEIYEYLYQWIEDKTSQIRCV